MDLLKRELERKKKALERAKQQGAAGDDASATTASRRYLKASQLRKLEEEAADHDNDNEDEGPVTKKQRLLGQDDDEEGKERRSRKEKKKSGGGEDVLKKKETSTHLHDDYDDQNDDDNDVNNTTTENVKNVSTRMRSMGLEVRLFGENDSDRIRRLREALDDERKQLATLSEKQEFKLGQGHGIRNPFLESSSKGGDHGNDDNDKQEGGNNPNSTNNDNGSGKKKKKDDNDYDVTNETDPDKRIYKYFKGLLKQWEDDLVRRPDSVKRSVAGKNETKTYQQCQDYIKPLFKLCRKRKLEPGLEAHLTKIVNYCLDGEFVHAHDAYMDVAIGRAAWPIGVTMVGIHARTGRAKIESSNVAHVMNSELQRKYLTSVKRLMSYAQKKRVDVDPSKKVMN